MHAGSDMPRAGVFVAAVSPGLSFTSLFVLMSLCSPFDDEWLIRMETTKN